MNITYVSPSGKLYLGARAKLVEGSDRLQAWAEKHVRTDVDIRWILGNFVEADRINDNGYIFPFADLPEASKTVEHKPLNMLHHQNYIVGTYAGAELIVPEGYDSATAEAEDDGPRPTTEALAAFWRSFFPEEYNLVERADKEGELFYSMECMPVTVTCPVVACGVTKPFAGLQHESYCAHMNESRIAPKRLDKPHFNAGALIIPPVRPGWRKADATALSKLLEHSAEEAERVYANLKTEFPHLDYKAWEAMVAYLMAEAWRDPALPSRPNAAGLIPKEQANYRDAGQPSPTDSDQTPRDRCGTCRNSVFVQGDAGDTGASMCQLVAGQIQRDDVCDLYDRSPTEVRHETWVTYNYDQAMAADSLLTRSVDGEARKEMAKKGHAMGDGSFPIENVEDLKNAIKAVGRAKDSAKAKSHIKKRARQLGAEDLIPEGW